MRAWLVMLVVSGLLLSCQAQEQPLPVAEWQFIDAETMQPIEGAWINFAWRGKPKSNGVSSCPRGVLGRSGKDGWFRDIGREPYWKVDPLPSYFVPGYEHFQYEYGVPDADHITAYIPYSETYLGTIPAFEDNLRKNGWVHHPGIIRDDFANKWTKVFPSKGFRDYVGHREVRQRYFMRYFSLPEFVGQSFSFMGKHCDDERADNIGLELKTIKFTDKLRAIHSTEYFCRDLWRGMKKNPSQQYMYIWMNRAFWLLPAERKPWDEMKILLPEHLNSSSREFLINVPLSDSEHSTFCNWIKPYLEKAILETRYEK
jgi:hypothetical protein